MKEEEDKKKLWLLKYLIGVDGIEIYNMLKIDKEENDWILKGVNDVWNVYRRYKSNKIVEEF